MIRTILPLLGVCALAFSNMGGCAGDGTASSGVHGELSAGTTIDPNNPTTPTVNIGGKIYFLKKNKKTGQLAKDKQGHLQAVDAAGRPAETSP